RQPAAAVGVAQRCAGRPRASIVGRMSTTTSPHPTVDADLELLSSRAADWAGLPIAEKRAVVSAVHEATAGVAGVWARLACRAKGLELGSPLAGEEWMSGPMAQLVYTTALGRT